MTEHAAVAPRGTPHDAVVPDPDATYATAAALPLVDDPVERATVSAQLGRPARGRSAVAHRCTYGLPTVLRVDPRLDGGTPFPTVFWLSCPLLRSRVGTLEADHVMAGLNDRLDADEELAAEYAAASQRYVAFRDELGGELPGDPSAGGMPGHIKCLHVAVAHHVAVGDNPVGELAFDMIAPMPCPAPCVDPEAVVDEWGPDGSEVR